jgi:hypothetical protein
MVYNAREHTVCSCAVFWEFSRKYPEIMAKTAHPGANNIESSVIGLKSTQLRGNPFQHRPIHTTFSANAIPSSV